MQTFRIYRHDTRPDEAVKVGPSWPAFFFGFFWLLFKRLWTPLLVVLAVVVTVSLLEWLLATAFPRAESTLTYVVTALCLVGWMVVAMRGNRLRAWVLRSKGYWQAAEVTAVDAQHALALATEGAPAATVAAGRLPLVVAALMGGGGLCAFVAAFFAFRQNGQAGLVFAVFAGVLMVAGAVVQAIVMRHGKARRAWQAGDAGHRLDRFERPASPDDGARREARRWRYGALGVLAVTLGLMLFAPLGLFDADSGPRIHPSVALHLAAPPAGPDALVLPLRTSHADMPSWHSPGETTVSLRPEPVVSADHIRQVRATYGEGGPVLVMTLSRDGAQRLADATAANLGGEMALVANGEVISLATIQSEIAGGELMVAGIGTAGEVQALVVSMHE